MRNTIIILFFLVTTCIGTNHGNDNVKYISQLDSAYLAMATHADGVVIDGIVENEVPRETVVDTQYFKHKTFKLYEIFNTDTTCIIPYRNYVYIVDFFGNFRSGVKIRFDDFVLFNLFRANKKDSDITFTWMDNTYQYYWMEPAYIRKTDAQRVLDESIVLKEEYGTYEELTDDEYDEIEDDEEDI